MIQPDVVQFDVEDVLEKLPLNERLSDAAEFVYLFQKYPSTSGSNFLIWTRDNSDVCELYMLATGPISVKVEYEKFLVDVPGLSRFECVEKAVKAAIEAQESEPLVNLLREATPLIDESRTISSREFDNAVRLSLEFETGDQSLLGVDSVVRVISRTEHGQSDASTWIGDGMTESAWAAINEMLDFGGFRQLPHRQFEASTGNLVES